MEKNYKNSLIKKTLLVAILAMASVLALTLYNLITNPKISVYGIDDGVNVSVQVEGSATCSPPRIDNVKPLTGSTSGGEEITITGDNLSCVDEVFVAGALKCEPITHINNQILKCTMPPHAEGYTDITVVSPGYGESTKNNGFLYLGDGDLPLPPNTGLFRLGDKIVTLYELLSVLIVMMLLGIVVGFALWRRSRQHRADKAT
jgi:hypothetical protein